MGFGVVRFDPDSLAICGDRLIALFLIVERNAKAAKIRRSLSILLYGLVDQFDGPVLPPALMSDQTEHVSSTWRGLVGLRGRAGNTPLPLPSVQPDRCESPTFNNSATSGRMAPVAVIRRTPARCPAKPGIGTALLAIQAEPKKDRAVPARRNAKDLFQARICSIAVSPPATIELRKLVKTWLTKLGLPKACLYPREEHALGPLNRRPLSFQTKCAMSLNGTCGLSDASPERSLLGAQRTNRAFGLGQIGRL